MPTLLSADIFEPMKLEIQRAMRELQQEDCPRPYFISLRLTQSWDFDLGYREGLLNFENTDETVNLVPLVRIGSPTFDQTPDIWSSGETSWPVIASSVNVSATRHYLWSVVDDQYKNACGLYLSKKAKRASEGVPDYVTDDFVPDLTITDNGKIFYSSLDASPLPERQELTNFLIEMSKELKSEPKIYRTLARFQSKARHHNFLNSEGRSLESFDQIYNLYLSLYGQSDLGLPLHLTRVMYSRNPVKIINRDETRKVISDLKKQYFQLFVSSEAKSAFAPCLLDPSASAWVFLAFSARLEGERQRDPSEPQTFRDKMNKEVLPSFLTIVDDPTLKEFGGRDLLGYYQFDEEAMAGRSVTLVQKGILRNLLFSRRPVKDWPIVASGHARAAATHLPHGRAGNLIVHSTKAYSRDKLKKLLIEEVQKRKFPFGIFVEGFNPSRDQNKTGSHQIFRGSPEMLYFIYPDGREELFHNGEIVGTPVKLMQSILATGDDYEASNLMADGPSGPLPTSVVSPSILVAEIEVQKGSGRRQRPPILKSPLGE